MDPWKSEGIRGTIAALIVFRAALQVLLDFLELYWGADTFLITCMHSNTPYPGSAAASAGAARQVFMITGTHQRHDWIIHSAAHYKQCSILSHKLDV